MPLESLRSRSAIENVLRSGRRIRVGSLVLYHRFNGDESNRYAVAAKVKAGKAVARNLIRRRLKARLRELDPVLAQGHDVYILAINSEAAESYDLLCRDLERALVKAGIANANDINKDG